MKGEDILRLFFRKHSVVVNDETLMKIVLERRALAADGIAHNVKLLPGAQKLIEGLRNLKIKTAIATSCSRHACGVVFEKYPFAGNFDFIITGGEVSKGKPDPEIFLKAASSLEVSPEQCLVFEDSSYGVRAGKNAGMKVVAVLTGHESKMVLMAEKPDLILETLEDFDLKKLEKL
jgi:HAD superfamily hydrolase (TIGR01509 family)